MDDIDVERVAAWLRAWGVEAVLGAVALVGLADGVLRGDRLTGALGVALTVAVVDRLRLRLDNRSLAAAVDEIREGRVSAARGGTPTGTTAAASVATGATEQDAATGTNDTRPTAAADDGGTGVDDGETTAVTADDDVTAGRARRSEGEATDDDGDGPSAVDRVGTRTESTDEN